MIRLGVFRPHWPLLGKELVELSARKRTYIVRALFAAGVLLFVGAELHDRYFQSDLRFALGGGARTFEFLVYMQFLAVGAIMPASMCGVLTSEKERSSLSLLLLTGLKPRQILAQKYLGRVLPMVAFLTISLPALALCYIVGGLTPQYLFTGFYLTILFALQLGAIALLASSWSATTTQAFLLTYVGGAVFYFGPLVLAVLLLDYHVLDDFVECWFLPVLFDTASRSDVLDVILKSVPVLVSISVMLAMARVFFVRRAMARRRNLVLGVFRRLDGFWKSLNDRVGGVEIIRERDQLPEAKPVQWRELNRKSLGRLSYLFRVLVLVEVPVLFVLMLAMFDSGVGGLAVGLYFLVWAVAALSILAVGAGLVSSERVNQTADVLLATPMSGREIILQKMRALRRLCIVCAVPLLTLVYVFVHVGFADDYRYSGGRAYLLPLTNALWVVIYLPMLAWFAMWISLKMKGRRTAVVAAIGSMTVWCLAPIIALIVAEGVFNLDEDVLSWCALSTPLFVLGASAAGALQYAFDETETIAVFVNASIYCGVWWFLRAACLRRADSLLGRASASPTQGRWRSRMTTSPEPEPAAEPAQEDGP